MQEEAYLMTDIDKTKEYYYSGAYVTIVGEIEGQPDLIVVDEGGDYGSMIVARKKELTLKEESYTYKQAQARADELRLFTQKAEEDFEAIVEKVIKVACKALQARIKMNVLFGSASSGNGWAVTVADELEKLIKEDTKKTIEKELSDHS